MFAMLISSCSKRPPLFTCALVALCLCFLAASCGRSSTATLARTPLQAEIGEFSFVGSNFDNICGLRTNGTVVCWGSNVRFLASPPQG